MERARRTVQGQSTRRLLIVHTSRVLLSSGAPQPYMPVLALEAITGVR